MAHLVDGYEADPDDVSAILAATFDEDDQRDPMIGYMTATKALALYEAVAVELRGARALAVKALADETSYQKTADLLGLHKSRIGVLVQEAKKFEEAKKAEAAKKSEAAGARSDG